MNMDVFYLLFDHAVRSSKRVLLCRVGNDVSLEVDGESYYGALCLVHVFLAYF